MADLLTTAEKEEFAADMDSLSDTFHKTPVKVIQYTKTFNQDGRKPDETPTETTVLCRVRVGESMSDNVEERETGRKDEHTTTFKFNMNKLDAEGLVSGDKATFNVERDFIEYNSKRYRLLRVDYGNTAFVGVPINCFVLAEIER